MSGNDGNRIPSFAGASGTGMTNPTLSVLIHTYRRYDYLATALEALRRQTLSPMEIIVTDQTPEPERPPGFYDSFRDLPLRLISLDRPMHAAAQNIAARQAKGEVLLSLDDDVDFGPDLLRAHLDVMCAENVDAVFGAITSDAPLPEHLDRDPGVLDPVSFFLKSPGCRWQGMTLVTSGANTSIMRKWFDRVGGYDEFIPRMADIEFGYRLFRAGAKILFSDKPVVNHRRAPLGGTRAVFDDLNYTRLQARLYLHRKHFPGWTTRQYVAYEVVNALLFRTLTKGIFDLHNLLQPFYPVRQLARLVRAWRSVSAMRRRVEEIEHGDHC